MADIASIPQERRDKIATIVLDVSNRLKAEGRLPAAVRTSEARAVPLRVMPNVPPANDAPPRGAVESQASAALAPAASTPEPVPAREAPARQEASADDSALMREEVEKGLHELLAGWDIFEKSGLFGMGGSGAEHPTYQKIRELPMEVVLAGSWSGADEGVAANINQYVAGWKAEHGLAPDPQETFEHYLRRVIDTYLKAGAA